MRTMKKLILPLLAVLFAASCRFEEHDRSQSHKAGTSVEPGGGFVEGQDYDLYERIRIWDREGYAEPVEAYSLLLPMGWHSEGGVKWIMPGQPCAGNTTDFIASSPDGQQVIHFYPPVTWTLSDDPLNNQLTQQGHPNCQADMPPQSAQAYLQTQFSAELGYPELTNIQSNETVAREMGEKDMQIRQELIGNGAYDLSLQHEAISAMLKWPDGREGIALIGLTRGELVVLNHYTGGYSRIYSGNTAVRVVYSYPEGQADKAAEQFAVMMSSRRTNPDWQEATERFWKAARYQQTADTRRKVALMDERTRAIAEQTIRQGNQRLADLDKQQRSWENKQRVQDKMHTDFIKTIRGVENFQDATGTVEVSAGYDHVWNSNDGSNTYIMSNDPNFDPASVFRDNRWQEMKKID